MEPTDPDAIPMLTDALERATKLLAELRKQAAEVEKSPPKIPPEKLAQGKIAMENAIASAQRMVDNINGALEIARAASN